MKKLLLVLILVCFSFPLLAATNYRAIDNRARRVPKQYEESLPKLVSYLTEPYQKSDERKARVLLAWIVYHIDYDDYKADKIVESTTRRRQRNARVSSGDIFETRVGVCEDIASLYQRMLGLAGLDSVLVKGYAGNGVTRQNMEQSRHMWNAVKIDDKWELVDPTWAVRGNSRAFQDVDTKSEHAREMKKRVQNPTKTNKARRDRSVDDRWFMTEPKEMIETHFPDDPQWQLLGSPRRIGSFLK